MKGKEFKIVVWAGRELPDCTINASIVGKPWIGYGTSTTEAIQDLFTVSRASAFAQEFEKAAQEDHS